MKNVSGRIWLVCSGAVALAVASTVQATTFSMKPVVLNPTCVAGANFGLTCVQDVDCDSPIGGDGVCQGTAITFTCAPGTPNAGAVCAESADCDTVSEPPSEDGCCGPDCAHKIRHVTTCQGGPNDGDPCDEHADCESAPGAWDFFCLGDYEIRLLANDVVITEIFGSDWSPNNGDREKLRMWNFDIVEAAFFSTSACQGNILPVGWDRPLETEVGECETDADCRPEWPICDNDAGDLNNCVGLNHHPETGFFIDSFRPDYVYFGFPEIVAWEYQGYRGGSMDMQPATYPLYVPPPNYLGTLALEVDSDVCGDFVIPFGLHEFDSAMYGPQFEILLPFVAENLVIQTIPEPQCVVSVTPENCFAIDPGQPREPDVSTLQGWEWMDFQFLAEDDLSTVQQLQFNATREPAFPPFPVWGIDHIEVNNVTKIVRVVFTDPATPGRWNCIEWEPHQQRFCFGYQPGDVTNDRASALNDIGAMINHLTGVPGHVIPDEESYRCDINRSGACTGADLLRVIDVLNGGNPYARWLDTDSLAECPTLDSSFCSDGAAKRARRGR